MKNEERKFLIRLDGETSQELQKVMEFYDEKTANKTVVLLINQRLELENEIIELREKVSKFTNRIYQLEGGLDVFLKGFDSLKNMMHESKQLY